VRKLPEYIPEYKIVENFKKPFSVKCEELMEWFIVPRLGEKITWGMYEIPSRRCEKVCDMQVVRRYAIHDVEGVEIAVAESSFLREEDHAESTFIAQLTDNYCRFLSTFKNDGNTKIYTTFLDNDKISSAWWLGENNYGSETNLSPKGDIRRSGTIIVTSAKDVLSDIVGRYTVLINEKEYDTVCVISIEPHRKGVLFEQFLDRNGKTVLWRSFVRDNQNENCERWSEKLPNNDILDVNGIVYVHHHDCVTDYIL